MVATSESGLPPFTLDGLRKKIAGLAGPLLIVCEDGNYQQSFVEDVKICWYAAIGDKESSKRVFLGQKDIDGYRKENPHIAIVKLEQPVLRIEYTTEV